MARPAVALAVMLCLAPAMAVESQMQSRANPVRKVVNLLQALTKKVEEEGKAEAELYEKYVCYCQTSKKQLEDSIAAASSAVSSTGPEVEAETSKVTQAQADVERAKADRKAAQDAIEEAKALRTKGAEAFAAEKAEDEANIEAIGKAVEALEHGTAGSFLQTRRAAVLRRLTTSGLEIADEDRQTLVAFLSQGDGYAPQSGEIVGILKQLKDQIAQGLEEATTAEEEAKKGFEELLVAKAKEVEALTSTVEAKLAQIGEVGVAVEQQKAGLADAQESLEEDKKFLAELEASCAAKAAEWEAVQKSRAEELVAIADTIKILNDDDALELFKSTLPSPGSSFLQVQVSMSAMRDRALAAVRRARHRASSAHRAKVDFLLLALNNKNAVKEGGFEKVTAMIDKLVQELNTEQAEDQAKKDYCLKEFALAEDKKKELEVKVSDAESAIGTVKESINSLIVEIGALQAGIRALDKSVVEATAQREAENAEFKKLVTDNAAAKELLGLAKNRLNKFYNPKLYKPEPAKEAEASFVQVSMHRAQRRDAPPPPPETFGAYAKKSEGTGGVIQLLDVLISDLDKETVQAETEEKNSQQDYETMVKDSQEKRTLDADAITQKEAAKADLEGTLEGHTKAKDEAAAELAAKMDYLKILHTDCDWLLQYFDMRKEARTDEIDALSKAKAVLSGADFAFVQVSAHRRLRRAAA